jgi:hypothetical protein
MARNKQAMPEVDKAALYLKGVAKNLVDRIYGPKGPAWGTKFTEIEATVAAIREVLTEEMFQQALSRQAAETERPPEYEVCPGCGRPTRPGWASRGCSRCSQGTSLGRSGDCSGRCG